MLPKKRSSGFTLIELMFVMTIMGILATIGFAKYMEFNRRQIVLQEARQLKSNLRLAQSKALNTEIDLTVCMVGSTYGDGNDLSLDGWYVDFPSNQSYRIYGKCGAFSFASQTYSTNSKVTFNPVPPSIIFRPSTQGVRLSSGNLPLSVNFQGFGIGQSVFIGASGEIK